jgi:undecaprenyl diphosphate synthase
MSLYAFSTENWKRPKDEIDHLFDYLDEFFKREIDNLMKDDVQVRTMGDLTRLPPHTQNTIKEAKERTKNNKTVILNICLNYGGRDEIVRAINNAINENNGEITEEKFATYLDSTGLPEVDLLIRTSGEQRLSNYMLWQMAYAEFIFTPTYWPDFKREHLIECLKEFESRNRRFGGL